MFVSRCFFENLSKNDTVFNFVWFSLPYLLIYFPLFIYLLGGILFCLTYKESASSFQVDFCQSPVFEFCFFVLVGFLLWVISRCFGGIIVTKCRKSKTVNVYISTPHIRFAYLYLLVVWLQEVTTFRGKVPFVLAICT